MRRAARGMSILEAIIASFMLLCSFLVVINLFHSAFHYGTRIENQQIGGMLAERQLERMRTWSETLNGTVYNYDNLVAVYDAQTTTASDFPNFSLATRVINQTLYSNCSTFERGVAAAGGQPRQLLTGARNVQVTVSWDQGSHQISLSSLFSGPPLGFRTLNPVVVSVVGSPSLPLAQDTTADFTATAFDPNGQPISDLLMAWDVVPVDGNGTLTENRDGTQATLLNAVNVSGTWTHTAGSLYVHVSAKYHGRTSAANSTVITLQ